MKIMKIGLGISCSRIEEEQNLVAFQYHGEIYYRLHKDINLDAELGIVSDDVPENTKSKNCYCYCFSSICPMIKYMYTWHPLQFTSAICN